jgi:PAS domain S-box-containing protein
LAAKPTPESAPSFLLAEGEMAARIRERDWSATTLGPPDRWPATLKAMVRMALTTRHPIFIFWGRDHTCIYNDAYSASLGPEKHPSILGARGRDAWPEIWNIIGPQIEMVLRGEGATWHENELVPIFRHGAIQDVYWTYSFGPINDEDAAHGVGGVLVVCTETTSQVMAERRLATERERFAQLFEQAPTFMAFLRGPEHLIELANPGYRRLVGQRPVVGRTVAEALPDAAEQGYVQWLDQVYTSGAPFNASAARYVFQMPDSGEEVERFVDFVYQPIKDSAGAVTGIFVEGVDVTERTLVTRALSAVQAGLLRSEEQLRLATEAAEVGLWDVDMLTDTLFWPPRVKAMFGISPDRSVSMTDFYAGLHPDDRAVTSAVFAAAVDPSRRSLYDVEYRTIGKEDGVIRWVAAKGRGIFDEEGRCVRVIGTAIDITRRKATETSLRQSEARLRIAMDALQDADRNKDAFLATLSHELRNPLATIRNSLTVMERARNDTAMSVRAREIMERQVEQLVRLTEDLLDVSRISLGKIALRRQVMSLNSILLQAVESCAPLTERTAQHLEISLPDLPAMVNGDSARLVQLFGNLISNASKFTPDGGLIEVAARCDDAAVVVSVKDSGIGLPPDKLISIFDAFTQLDNPIGRSNAGLGIGLALSKQLVDMHGGEIEARSAGPGFGSEFLVRLPLVRTV